MAANYNQKCKNMIKNHYQGIYAYVVKQVRKLMKDSAIYGVEIEDLEQELMLDYLSHKHRPMIPKKQNGQFLLTVFSLINGDNLIELIRAQNVRSGIREFSLDAWFEDKDGAHNALRDPTTENLINRNLHINLKWASQQLPLLLTLFLLALLMCFMILKEIIVLIQRIKEGFLKIIKLSLNLRVSMEITVKLQLRQEDEEMQ
ncbi:hypothetical protein [Bartonella sp. B17]